MGAHQAEGNIQWDNSEVSCSRSQHVGQSRRVENTGRSYRKYAYSDMEVGFRKRIESLEMSTLQDALGWQILWDKTREQRLQ